MWRESVKKEKYSELEQIKWCFCALHTGHSHAVTELCTVINLFCAWIPTILT